MQVNSVQTSHAAGLAGIRLIQARYSALADHIDQITPLNGRFQNATAVAAKTGVLPSQTLLLKLASKASTRAPAAGFRLRRQSRAFARGPLCSHRTLSPCRLAQRSRVARYRAKLLMRCV